mgnify:FL=1|jgi:hypothetical protein
MRQIKILILYIFFAFFMYGCSNMSEAKRVLKGEKRQTDEFLVKKKEPLTQPPDFYNLPDPNSLSTSKKDQSDVTDDIFKLPKTKNTQKRKNNSTTEESILSQID